MLHLLLLLDGLLCNNSEGPTAACGTASCCKGLHSLAVLQETRNSGSHVLRPLFHDKEDLATVACRQVKQVMVLQSTHNRKLPSQAYSALMQVLHSRR